MKIINSSPNLEPAEAHSAMPLAYLRITQLGKIEPTVADCMLTKVEFLFRERIFNAQSSSLYNHQVTGLLTIEFLFKDGGMSFEEAETVPGVHRFQIKPYFFRGQRYHHQHYHHSNPITGHLKLPQAKVTRVGT